MHRPTRLAFTLRELLVVVTVLSVLMAVVSYFVRQARVKERHRVCFDNMRSLGQAMASYESVNQRYPGYLNVITQGNGMLYTNPHPPHHTQGVSWAVVLLQFINTHTVVSSNSFVSGSSAGAAANPRVLFSCPSHRLTSSNDILLSYAANAGCRDQQTADSKIPRDWPSNGVFFDRYSDDPATGVPSGRYIVSISNANIKDGTGATLMLAENVDGGDYLDYVEELLGITWNPSYPIVPSPDTPHVAPARKEEQINGDAGGRAVAMKSASYQPPAGGINAPTSLAYYARPASYHPGGVNVVFCDGHVTFLSEEIDYYVYGMLMNSDSLNVKQPGNTAVIRGWARPIHDIWITAEDIRMMREHEAERQKQGTAASP